MTLLMVITMLMMLSDDIVDGDDMLTVLSDGIVDGDDNVNSVE